MSITTRQFTIALIGVGLTCIAAGLLPLMALAQADTQPTDPAATDVAEMAAPDEAAAQSIPEGGLNVVYPVGGEPVAPTGDNSYCQLCHAQSGRLVTLPNGDVLSLFVSTDTLSASIHGTRNEQGALGCIDCHGDNAFPHSGPTPADSRTYTIDAVQMCVNCHVDQVETLEQGLHAQAIRAGNMTAAVCTDCHGAHDVESVTEYPELLATVCGDCHTATLQEWRVSAHAEMGDAGCSTCHSPHAQTLRVGEDSTALCMNCHEEMDPILVHVQHAGDDYPVECVDCHMYVPEQSDTILVSYEQMPSGHSMQMDSTPCTTCHEALVAEGRWDQLVADNETPTEIVVGVEPEAAERPVQGSNDLVQLLQGLVLGLGFGATAAAIFIARGNRATPAGRTSQPPSAPEAEVPAQPADRPTADDSKEE